MGVTVRVSIPANRQIDQYQDVKVDHAHAFRVTNECLFLYDSTFSDAKVLSVYNKGAWLGAWLDGDDLTPRQGDS